MGNMQSSGANWTTVGPLEGNWQITHSKGDAGLYNDVTAIVSISGHYTESNNTEHFRLFENVDTGALIYFPNETGSLYYQYKEHNRLEEYTWISAGDLDEGTWNARFEVKRPAGDYKWNQAYG